MALRTSAGAALVYGLRTQQATLTASKMPGPGGGYLAWSAAPAWEGEVRLATWDPTAGLGVPEVLFDGVVSTAGQAEIDGAGAVHLALQDLEWATRYAVLDSSLVP